MADTNRIKRLPDTLKLMPMDNTLPCRLLGPKINILDMDSSRTSFLQFSNLKDNKTLSLLIQIRCRLNKPTKLSRCRPNKHRVTLKLRDRQLMAMARLKHLKAMARPRHLKVMASHKNLKAMASPKHLKVMANLKPSRVRGAVVQDQAMALTASNLRTNIQLLDMAANTVDHIEA